MKNITNHERWNTKIVEKYGFFPCEESSYNPLGKCYKLSKELGNGCFWAYSEKDLFDIKIHNFYYHNDTLIKTNISGYLGINYYESVSAEQLTPNRKMTSNCIQVLVGKNEPYKILIHKKVPIKSVGIELKPSYYEKYIKEYYPEENFNPVDVFTKLNEEEVYPNLVFLFNQIKNYSANGLAGKLFYKGKVNEIVALMLSHLLKTKKDNIKTNNNFNQIKSAVNYINNFYTEDISLEYLAQLSYMSISSFKSLFKQLYNCSVTEYIQKQRLNKALALLEKENMSISEIAKIVGYSTSSRLAKLFKKNIGITPREYKKIIKNQD